MATRQQPQQSQQKQEHSKMDTCAPMQQQPQQQRLKRKREDDDGGGGGGDDVDMWRPPKRVSPFLNTPKQRRDEKRKLLRTSINKLREIENAEVCLHRAVLLHNTVRKLQKQLRDEKHTVPTPSAYGSSDRPSYLSANAHLFVDHFVYSDMEQIVDNSDLLDRMIGSLQSESEVKMTRLDNPAIPKPVNLSSKDNCVYVDENCNQNQYTQVPPSAGQYNVQRSLCDGTSGDVPCDFTSSLNSQLYPHPPTPPPILHAKDTSCAQSPDSSVLDMRLKEDKVDDLIAKQSSGNCDSSLSSALPLTLSRSIARAMNCVEGGGNDEDLARSVIMSSSPPPSPCLAGHTGYFSVISSDSTPSPSYSTSTSHHSYHNTSNQTTMSPHITSQHITSPLSSSSSAACAPAAPPAFCTSVSATAVSTCSEAYQRERSSPACLSPFLALLDEPWSVGDGGPAGGGPDKTAGGGTGTSDLDSVLGSLIGVLTGTC